MLYKIEEQTNVFKKLEPFVNWHRYGSIPLAA